MLAEPVAGQEQDHKAVPLELVVGHLILVLVQQYMVRLVAAVLVLEEVQVNRLAEEEAPLLPREILILEMPWPFG